MILRHLRVEEFRCHNRPLDVSFDKRITIIEGPNGAGKSTLFEALQYVLFRRSNATARDIKALAPWDTTGLAPSVELEFAHAGTEYRLRKQFGRSGTTRLEKKNASGLYAAISGDAAERFISDIFANVSAVRGAQSGLTAQQQGIAHVLFTPQAAIPITKTGVVDLGVDARARLTQIVGSAAQTPAAAKLSDAIDTRYREMVSSRGPRAGSPLVLAQAALAIAEANTARARSAKSAFTEALERLERLDAEASEATAEAEAAGRAVTEQRPRFEQAARAEQALRDAEAAFAQRIKAYNDLVEEKRRFEEATSRRNDLKPERSKLKLAVTETSEACEAAEAARAAAQAAFESASAPNPELEQLATELEVARQRDARCAQLAALEQRLEAVRQHRAEQSDLEQQLGELGNAGPKDLATLQKLTTGQAELATQIAASETSVTFEPDRKVEITLHDGTTVHKGTYGPGNGLSHRSLQTLTLQIAGIGTLIVQGPAGDAEALAREHAACDAEIAAFEADFGTRDPFVLQERILRATELKGLLRKSKAALAKELAGEAEPELSARAEGLRSASAGAPVEATTDIEDRLAKAKDAFEAARARATAAFTEATSLEQAAHRNREDAVEALAAFESGPWHDIEVELAALTRDGVDEAKRKERIAASYLAQETAEIVLANAKDAHAPFAGTNDPLAALAGLTAEAQRTALAAQRAVDAVKRLREEIAAMRLTSPDAELARCEEEEDRCRACRDDTQASLDALALLNQLVAEEQAQRVSAFGRPVLQRVSPWFEDVTGHRLASCDLDANIALGQIQLAGVTQPIALEELSQGERDQLGLLIRLALAALLTQPDCLGPMPVLLDDPLVHASAERRRAMLDVLAEVSRTAQVIVFTCRPEDYAGAGGSQFSMPGPGTGAPTISREVA